MVGSVVEKIALGVLVVCLLLAGIILPSTGWWLPEVTLSVRFLGLCWLFVCVTTGFIQRRPYLQLASTWLWLFGSVWWWWTATDEKSFVWFLYQDIFPLIVLAFSHFIVLGGIGRRHRRHTYRSE